MNSVSLKVATHVAKEDLGQIHFPKEEVLIGAEQRAELKATIDKALKLGNALKGKVKIVFEDDQGLKTVETTIWGVTNKNIILKRETLIPIRRIHEIKFY